MDKFYILNKEELIDYNGDDIISLAAGALLGTIGSLPYAVYTGNSSAVEKAAIAGASVGAGCPLP